MVIPSPSIAGSGYSPSIDPQEIARFAAIADAWWNPEGEFRPLHRLNPVRLGFLRERLVRHFGRDSKAMAPFGGLRLLDIGCGGGLVAEPMARLGFAVTAIDAGAETVETARLHAGTQGLAIDYRHAAAEDLAAAGETFDVVLALEIVEHVTEPSAFLASVGALARPGGAAVLSTLNRTAKSWALGIVTAEYLLRWVPRGTHSWAKFLKPSELAAGLRNGGLAVTDIAGLGYDPLADRWAETRDLGVNYMMLAVKPGA